MIEIAGDIWEAHALGHWIVITTNGIVRKDGACVMGRGVARDAALRFPQLPYRLGRLLREYGNHVFRFDDYRIVTYPVKHHWREHADLNLIVVSATELLTKTVIIPPPIYLPRPGCGNGGLNWYDVVRPVLFPLLDDRFIVCHKNVTLDTEKIEQ